ncbi:hemerythrin domain-containing protein [Noviherbaspirillum massiliense]|uniref:hemerythrin domain-containing protein n=1 Tax=Noviherbaspirillum massiliense TaxID=1465823 RepID=UPI0002FC909A|nr:hemerythrin domain-containing protein [Noviherbaspirillum massiliense]
MDTDFDARRRGEFPVDAPIEALKTDHALVRQLFDRYFQAKDMNEKKDIGRRLLVVLEEHTALEEGAFYPRVRTVDPSLVDQCEQEHEKAQQLMDRFKITDESDPRIDQLYRQLADAILAHVDNEEQHLFPKIENAQLDLGAIGREMQTFEISMIADRLQKPIAPGLRV